MSCNCEIILISEQQLHIFLLFLLLFGPCSGHGLSFHKTSRYHSYRAHNVGFFRARDQTLRALPEKSKHSKQADIQVLGGIWNPNRSKRTDADPRLKSSGHKKGFLSYIHILSGDS